VATIASPKVDLPLVIALPANHAGIEMTIHKMTKPMMVTSRSVKVRIPMLGRNGLLKTSAFDSRCSFLKDWRTTNGDEQ
jgi:hypothetical protein